MARPRRDGAPATAPNKRRLNNFMVTNLKPQPRPYLVWDSLQRGLAIQVQPSDHRTWYCLYTAARRLRWYRIADASAIGLAEARLLAGRVMFKVAEGADPAAERMASRNADSFEDLAIRYRKYSARKNKSWQQPDKLVRKHLLPHWAKLRAADVSRSDVKAMMARIEAPIVANQTLAAASAIFSWAIGEEFAGVKINPCQKIERNKTTSRERVLSDSEVPLFWTAFDSADLAESVALKMILLTGQRPGEVTFMRTEHVQDGWWTLPGDPVPALSWPGTKNGKSHRVWLPAPAQQIIAEMDATGRLFGSLQVSYLGKAMGAICTALKVARCTPHDLRRTHGTTITGLGFGRDAMNRIQNHREGGIADVYDQHRYAAENQKIMEAVADRIFLLLNGSPANVLPFKSVSA
jgi:integrase